MAKRSDDEAMTNYQLALISNAVFDIGPRTRIVIFMFGLIGIAMAFMASLVSHENVPLDKVIHFTSYTILAGTFVLALRPAFFIPGLFGLVGMSIGIEFLQKYTGRSFDVKDMVANACGVGLGGMLGLTFRWIFSLVSREMAAQQARQKLVYFKKGEVLVREGDPIHEMLIINTGRVRATRNVNGRETSLMTAGPGEVLGVLGTIEERPQYATLRALEDTAVYRMNMQELMASAGGDQLPASLVLTGLSRKVRLLADQAVRSGRPTDVDATMA
ncbi:cyclic nucleotide-binding domain-containing protein [Pontiellaceae bacterium B12227]|nr:cyclic nucleotide-binding domain-containing protein [Pontiellaceae bacterium B12227]